ncbi:MAG TPA: hypothetical protein VGZ90_13485 [Puia sp.]|jgi:protein required for attachment to host cells|nr:hypothetical protein [Puia sp.]
MLEKIIDTKEIRKQESALRAKFNKAIAAIADLGLQSEATILEELRKEYTEQLSKVLIGSLNVNHTGQKPVL